MPHNAQIRQSLADRGLYPHTDVITEFEEIFADATRRRFLVTAQLDRRIETTPSDGMNLIRLGLHDELESMDMEFPGWTRRRVLRSATFFYTSNGEPRNVTVSVGAGGRNNGVTRLEQMNSTGMLATMEKVTKSSDTVTMHDIKLSVVIEYDKKVGD